MTAAAPSANRWLFGPAPDLLLGCGVLYGGLFVAFAWGGDALVAAQPMLLFPFLVLLLSMPHYGATLLRVYEERSSRRAYAIFSVWATLAVGVAFVAGTYSSLVAALMVTLYFTWSPWHYTGQNYGLAVMFLRRRGVAVTDDVKRFLYASFILSYVLVFLMMHGSGSVASDQLAARGYGFSFLPIGIPKAVLDLAIPVALGAYATSLVGAGFLLSRRASWSDLLPSALLATTQALWFSVPYAMHHASLSVDVTGIDWSRRDYFLTWIVLGHAIQYLWVTTYYARAAGGWRGYTRYFGKVLVSGVALWTLPVVVFAPGRIGDLGFHTGLGLLLTSAINIHHFILDGAIWKLRSSKIASVLIRSGTGSADEPDGGGSPWRRRAVWGVATAGLAIGLLALWDESNGYPNAMRRGDYAAARASLDRLRLFGRDNFVLRRNLRKAKTRAERGVPPGGEPRAPEPSERY